jgi:hypothetical protein
MMEHYSDSTFNGIGRGLFRKHVSFDIMSILFVVFLNICAGIGGKRNEVRLMQVIFILSVLCLIVDIYALKGMNRVSFFFALIRLSKNI